MGDPPPHLHESNLHLKVALLHRDDDSARILAAWRRRSGAGPVLDPLVRCEAGIVVVSRRVLCPLREEVRSDGGLDLREHLPVRSVLRAAVLRPAVPARLLVRLARLRPRRAQEFPVAHVLVVLRPDAVEAKVRPRHRGVVSGCRWVPEARQHEAVEIPGYAKRRTVRSGAAKAQRREAVAGVVVFWPARGTFDARLVLWLGSIFAEAQLGEACA
jgi:hypothetical protein